ncbi:tail fiber protein [Yersinia enterocolitica]|nr:tail fiber protein [Yersinia enterocolitica]HEN3491314.1 tail fiber protein [Yersinia enterocolitica]
MASVLADFIATQSGNDVLDNGNTATLLASLELAIKKYANSNLPIASTSQQGITQLSSLTNSSSETLAATLKAVKAVSDAGLKIAGNLAEIKAAGPAAVTATLANLSLGDVAHLPQLTGVVGTSRNAKMSVTAASSTATFMADELIVQTALGGLQYKLSSFSKTINLATTGVGGMDTGTVPANGFVALYAIYNPTTQISALLAVNASSVVVPEVYGGSNMPAGYTASALVAVLPVTTSRFAPFIHQGRKVSIIGASILSGSSTPSSLAALTVSAVPLNTTLIRMAVTVGIVSPDTTSILEISANAVLVGAKQISLGASLTGGTLSTTSYMEMPVVDNSRQIYWRIQGSNTAYGITAMGYEF